MRRWIVLAFVAGLLFGAVLFGSGWGLISSVDETRSDVDAMLDPGGG